MSEKRKIVVTSALPYANGDIHLGHLVEYIQTDFWVRFQKMRGHDCVYICADDTHGTPIMIRARKEGITPEQLIARSHETHLKDFTDFQVAFDNYYTTNSPENKELSERIYSAAEKQGFITKKTTPQLYCEHCKMFLPDRFVKGTCPKCGAPNQYGDSCDHCGATYGAEELGSPKCTTCGGTPVVKDSEHLYFELEPQHDYLEKWIPGHTTSDVSNKLLEWFKEPLRGWCISRDAPYFGFEIPGYKDKFFYVWVDAPIGYIASLKNWCDRNGKGDLWNDESVELYHFIGKDIIRFHCLFWPGMLHAAGFKGPDKVFVHGFLTVNGEKMSKSKGTFVNARTYLDNLPPEALRYYYAAKLGGTTDDMDLNLQDFVQRVNSDLVGKITNIASRSAQMLQKKSDGRLGKLDDEGVELLAKIRAASETIAQYYEDRRFNLAVVEICKCADLANEYFDRKEPWKLIKTDVESARTVLTTALNAFRILAIYLKPILPVYADKAMKLFGEEIAVNAEITYLPGKSGHADRDGLMNWLRGFEKAPKMIFVNHGEDSVTDSFAEYIMQNLGWNAFAPFSGTVFDLAEGCFVEAPEGIPIVKKSTQRSQGGSEAAELYTKLCAAGDSIARLIRESRGYSNKELRSLTKELENIFKRYR